jgi:Tfp pilus assembly protein PilX
MIMAAIGSSNQRGAVLVIGLIMLLLVTLMVVAGFNLTQTNLQAAQNMESRRLAFSAASSALEEAISSAKIVTSPAALFSVGCGQANSKCYDVNGDTIDDITVAVDVPSCVIITAIKNNDLVMPRDASCFVSGVNSLCVNAVFELKATATDNLTGAQAVITQGVGMRASKNNVSGICL